MFWFSQLIRKSQILKCQILEVQFEKLKGWVLLLVFKRVETFIVKSPNRTCRIRRFQGKEAKLDLTKGKAGESEECAGRGHQVYL